MDSSAFPTSQNFGTRTKWQPPNIGNDQLHKSATSRSTSNWENPFLVQWVAQGQQRSRFLPSQHESTSYPLGCFIFDSLGMSHLVWSGIIPCRAQAKGRKCGKIPRMVFEAARGDILGLRKCFPNTHMFYWPA